MYVTARVEGINLEKLLRAAAQDGIYVRHARRMGSRTMLVCLRADSISRFRKLCAESGWTYQETNTGCMLRGIRFLRRRFMLIPSAVLCALLVWLSSQMILSIRINNAQENAAEIRQFLLRHGVHEGKLKTALSLDALRAAAAYELPDLAFAGMHYAGSTFVFDAQSAVDGEDLAIAGKHMDVVAVQSGIVTRISVQNGTPLVEPGQAVRKGQVLIAGSERTQKGGQVAVRAQGQVFARVYASAEAKVSLKETRTVETGQTCTRVSIASPWYRRVVRDAKPFDSQDVSRVKQPVVGLYLPLWREIETYAQTEVFQEARKQSDAASIAQGAAEKIAGEQCPPGALILDKWVNYSMIDNEFVYARVVLEYETAIAGRIQ